jgi:hypothetical protein
MTDPLEVPADPEKREQAMKRFWADYRGPGAAPAKEDRMRCMCGNEHFFVTKIDFTCTVCFKSYRD